MGIRLNKYVQENLGMPRRKFMDMVKQGKVFVNGSRVDSYSFVLNGGEELEIKGENIKQRIRLSSKKTVDIIVFNKPVGVVCSKSDKYNKTIYEILPKKFKNYFYIGRLDKDSRGLVLMTNDSGLVNQFEHPKNKIEKEYIVEIDKNFNKSDYVKIMRGVFDNGEKLRVKSARYYSIKNKFFLNVVLLEGKKRHIRRILDNLGYNVLDLQRVREGKFRLGNVKEGNWISGDLAMKKSYVKKNI